MVVCMEKKGKKNKNKVATDQCVINVDRDKLVVVLNEFGKFLINYSLTIHLLLLLYPFFCFFIIIITFYFVLFKLNTDANDGFFPICLFSRIIAMNTNGWR